MGEKKKVLSEEKKVLNEEKKVLSEEDLCFVNGAGVPAMMNIDDRDKDKDDPWQQH